MASNLKDSSGYNSWEAKTVRGIDRISGTLKSTWDNMCFNGSATRGLVIGAAITAGAFGIGAYEYSVQEGPRGGTPSAQLDYDLTGDALMARSYSFRTYDDITYFLMHDVDHYELYQWNDERRTIDLIPYEHAKDIIPELAGNFRSQIDGFNLNPDTNYISEFRKCDLIHEPRERADGSFTRYYQGCSTFTADGDEIVDIYEANWAFWNEAAENLTADNYGIDIDDAVRYSPADRSHMESFLEKSDDNLAYGFGGWLLLGAAGAGIGGLRRRAERKMQGPL
jgi:hypothetical protein